MVASTNHLPGTPTGFNQSRTTPTGAYMTVATASRHQAKTSGSPARFNIRFHEAWAKADNTTSNRDTPVMGRSIASPPTALAADPIRR